MLKPVRIVFAFMLNTQTGSIRRMAINQISDAFAGQMLLPAAKTSGRQRLAVQ